MNIIWVLCKNKCSNLPSHLCSLTSLIFSVYATVIKGDTYHGTWKKYDIRDKVEVCFTKRRLNHSYLITDLYKYRLTVCHWTYTFTHSTLLRIYGVTLHLQDTSTIRVWSCGPEVRWAFPVSHGLLVIPGDIFDCQFGASGSEATDMAQHPGTYHIFYKQDSLGIQCRLSLRNSDAHIPLIFPKRESEKFCQIKV